MKLIKRIINLSLLTLLTVGKVNSQSIICPSVNAQVATGPSTTICQGNCASLTATVTPVNETTNYSVGSIPFAPQSTVGATSVVLSDDSQAGPFNIGFNFCFFGNTYNQFYIGSNGWVGFTAGQSNAFTSASIPSGAINVPKNCIMGPWQDWHPGIAGGPYISYRTIGTAPCRALVVTWFNCPMFSCTTTKGTFQIIIYETTNFIENHITNKPNCITWAGGTAVQGIHNLPGTIGITVPGRNSTQWTAVNQGWRWTPTGAPTYTINWTGPSGPLGTGSTVVVCPLTTGIYTANATLGGCIGSTNISHTVQVIVTPIPTITVNNPTICPGNPTTLTAVGATSYTWQPGNIVGPSAVYSPTTTTVYTVVGTVGTCTSSTTSTITVNNSITTSIIGGTIACFGGVTSATTNPIGGGPYTYTWNSIPTQNTQIANNLPVGNYTVTVNSLGCLATASITITQPTSLTVATSQTNVTCFGGNNGQASAIVAGGTPNYTYSWNTIPIQTSSTATSLPIGSYICTITDANGCIITTSVTITQPIQITVPTNQVNTTCGLPNGSATANPLGGNGPYTYLWSNGQTTQTAINLLAGPYTVTVTSVNGCTATAAVNILNTGAPIVTIPTTTNVSCFGGSNGGATSNLVGGVGPFTYTWSTIPVQNTPNATNLTAGNYTLTVTGSNGCSATATITITQPTSLTVTGSQTNVSCFGGNNGSVTVTPAGGTPGYIYIWSTVPVQNTSVATNLTIGGYTVTVIDLNGCLITKTYTITQPTLLTTSTTQTNVTCFGGNNGSTSVTPVGGTGPYTYTWSTIPVQNTAQISNLIVGNYSVTVTDANGCTSTSTVTITQPTQITSITSMTISTCGQANGSASVSPSGGVGPYTYLWSNGGTTQLITGLLPGVYNVTVTGIAGCTATNNILVTSPNSPTLSISSNTNVSCFGGNNGGANSNINGGVGPFTYTWNSVPVQNTSNAIGLIAGNYSVTVTDLNGCQSTSTVTITQPTQLVSAITTTNVSCFGGSNGSAMATPNGGTPGYIYTWNSAPIQNTQIATNLPTGTYSCTITDLNGCQIIVSANIIQPTQLTTSILSQTNISCFGGNNGIITTSVTGGVGPNYLYSLNAGPNQLSPTFNGLTAGTYTINVTDQNGCTSIVTTTLTQPSALTINGSVVNILCFNTCNGEASVNVGGGTPGYVYNWSNGGTTNTITGLCAGTYSVTVTDLNGCQITLTGLSVNQPSQLTINPNALPTTICVGQSSNLNSNVNGGVGPYTYTWSNGGTTSNITVSPTVTTNYTVNSTDANGCTISSNITVVVNPKLTGLASSIPSTVCAGQTSTISASANGGTGGPYTFVWNPGGPGQVINVTPLTTTIYIVTISDGCSSSITVTTTVNVNQNPIITYVTTPLLGCVPLTVKYTNTTPNSSNCLWVINNTPYNSCTTSQTYSTPGTYSAMLTVTDNNGCSNTSNIIIANAQPMPVAHFTLNPKTTDILSPTIEFTNLSTLGGYQWDFGDGNTSVYMSPIYTYNEIGTYTVQLIVTTQAGCSDVTYNTVIINDIFAVYVPNAFSPNDDGTNDTFSPVVTGAEFYEFWVFDRWGEQIYYSTKSGTPWDGKYKGESVQDGVYVWKLHIKEKLSPKVHDVVGHVTILK